MVVLTGIGYPIHWRSVYDAGTAVARPSPVASVQKSTRAAAGRGWSPYRPKTMSASPVTTLVTYGQRISTGSCAGGSTAVAPAHHAVAGGRPCDCDSVTASYHSSACAAATDASAATASATAAATNRMRTCAVVDIFTSFCKVAAATANGSQGPLAPES